MKLTNKQFDQYLAPLTQPQAESITSIRALINQYDPGLSEQIDTGKWYGGLLVYRNSDESTVYALGPRANGKTTFHILPYYASSELQEKYGKVLAQYLSGKSCLLFAPVDELPIAALAEVISGGSKRLAQAKDSLSNRKAI
jgi:hypothetical protein